MLRVAVLDDYSGAALRVGDWTVLDGRAAVSVFDRAIPAMEAATALRDFDVLCTMRERMAFPADLLAALPNLKLITITGRAIPNLDLAAAAAFGIPVSATAPDDTPERARAAAATPELVWGLLIATVRHLAFEDRQMRRGAWQSTTGMSLAGKTLGLAGLGRIGRRIAQYGQAFDMQVIAWSQNLSDDDAARAGVRRVEKSDLLRDSDVVSVHYKLGERSRGLIGASDLALMKPTAFLINTSRGPIVDEAALLDALRARRIAGAGLDVYDLEPLPADHPFRSLDNVTLSPHLGYVTDDVLRFWYADTIEAVGAYIDGAPIRVLNPEYRRTSPARG